MTLEGNSFYIRCDRCHAESHACSTRKAARDLAASLGWRRGQFHLKGTILGPRLKSLDLCPECYNKIGG